eukprot:Gregarina_sp_Pseudo_9__1542@NODE_2034_length_1190_cov_60_200695_g1879_i0_p1_GENE_NODE_2034_length_1190_cov_60_200695_g1879_i0NODE_2034_length_1190_cov_60_200695_g1879_i0_p1_ORF_typecomplete_len300_score30_81_NODE_2034_length_1190_cov_60_200695_g1879_i01011000
MVSSVRDEACETGDASLIPTLEQCKFVMERHSKEEDFDENSYIEDHSKLCQLTPLFWSDFRNRANELVAQAKASSDRGTLTEPELTVSFVEAFGAALDLGNPSSPKVPSILGEDVEGIVYIQSTARDSEWAFAFVYMRGLILEWIRQGLFTLETAPHKLAIVHCYVEPYRMVFVLRRAILTGLDLTIEYEDELRKTYWPDYSDYKVESALTFIFRRLVWLTPFDIVSVPKGGLPSSFFKELKQILLNLPKPKLRKWSGTGEDPGQIFMNQFLAFMRRESQTSTVEMETDPANFLTPRSH